MYKNEIKNSVIMMMGNDLTAEQTRHLQNCLDIVLHKYGIVKDETTEVSCISSDENYKYMKRFEIDMKIEGLSEKTIEAYIRETTKFLDFFNKSFKNITKDDITYYLAMLIEKGLSNTTVDNTRKFIKSFFNWCVYSEIIEKNPFLKIKCIKRSPINKDVLTELELESLRDACNSKRDLAIIDFLNSTGVRVSELTALKKKDVDFVNGKCEIYSHKTDTVRNVFLDAKALKHLCDYQTYLLEKGISTDYVFTSEKRTNSKDSLSNGTIEKLLHKLESNISVNKRITVHTFRKTFASRCSKKGISPTTICSLMGHSSFSTTAKYYIATDNENIRYEYNKFLN